MVPGGGLLPAIGSLTGAGLTLALALVDSLSSRRTPAPALQTLSALNENFHIPCVGGMGPMLLGAGPVTVRAAVVIGVLVFIPRGGFLAFMAAGLWGVVTGVLLSRRLRRAHRPGGWRPGPPARR